MPDGLGRPVREGGSSNVVARTAAPPRKLCLDDRATLGGLIDLRAQDTRAIGVLEQDDAIRE
jgi:hypothetical protein